MNPQAPGGGVPEPPPSSGGDASDTGTELRRTRIMVIDDDWLVATALSRILTKSYDVVTEHSGTAALETLRRDPAFDVIVCDVMMPEMDGPTLYEALASYEPHLRSRFLFISGGDVSLGPQRFLEQSAVKLLKKPVRRADLYEAVAELVASTM